MRCTYKSRKPRSTCNLAIPTPMCRITLNRVMATTRTASSRTRYGSTHRVTVLMTTAHMALERKWLILKANKLALVNLMTSAICVMPTSTVERTVSIKAYTMRVAASGCQVTQEPTG